MWSHIPNWRQPSNISEHTVYVWGNGFFINTFIKTQQMERATCPLRYGMYAAGSSSWDFMSWIIYCRSATGALCFSTHLKYWSELCLQLIFKPYPEASPLFLPISSFSLFKHRTSLHWTYFMSILSINCFLIHNKNSVLSMYVKLVSGQVSMHIWLRAEQTATCF